MPKHTRKRTRHRRRTLRRIPRRGGGRFPMLPPTQAIRISNPESSDNVLAFHPRS